MVVTGGGVGATGVTVTGGAYVTLEVALEASIAFIFEAARLTASATADIVHPKLTPARASEAKPAVFLDA